jgi:hypothetical protein
VSVVAAQGGGTDTVVLTWTAPGDDSLANQASLYDVRYSTAPITEENWNDALRGAVFRPSAPGTVERCQVFWLDPRTDYYFAVKTMDHQTNLSPLSNIAVRRARGIGIESAFEGEVLELSLPRPNPARYTARISWNQSGPGMVQVEAFDITGRRVRTLMSGVSRLGPTELAWDLTDDGGRPLQAGVYLIRAHMQGITKTRRLMIAR